MDAEPNLFWTGFVCCDPCPSDCDFICPVKACCGMKEGIMSVNRFREQWNNDIEDNFGSIMPLMLFRVTWKDNGGNCLEFWTESYQAAFEKKYLIDHSNDHEYINFESWFAYRGDEHDKRFGRRGREFGWWEK